MTRIIFLDMDGVLSSPRAWVANTGVKGRDRWIDPIAMRYLNILCARSGALVVVSSTWRLLMGGEEFGYFLKTHGFTGKLHKDWRTKDIRHHISEGRGIRGDEVAEWLDRHAEVTNYLIIDDDGDFHVGQTRVQTDAIDGFLYRHFEAAFKLICPGQKMHVDERPGTALQKDGTEVFVEEA